ncbi:MAG: HAD-IA family hydrolase [Acidobacteriaceae bacterium]|nr:HAD-IA family hydrolase [Acidobacteriaceae bacterium]
MNTARAVLWDMDGTLVDSEELHWLSWRETMVAVGIPITYEQFLASFGKRNDSVLAGWLGPAATSERIEKISDLKDALFRDLVRANGISALPGVPSWVNRLHREGWLQAIGSSAPRRNIEVVLEALGLMERFGSIVSAEDVKRGKPDPEVYITAASRVGAPSQRCIVVEDAVAGIEAAHSAGMRSIGVSHHGKNLPADLVIPSLDLLHPDAFDVLLPIQ